MQRRRSQAVTLGVTAAVALALTGCGTDGTIGGTFDAGSATSTAVPVDAPDDTDVVVDDPGTDATDASGEATEPAADDAQYGAVCVDQQTQERVDDDQCGAVDPQQQTQAVSHGHGSIVPGLVAWYFLTRGSRVPAMGARVSHGTFAAPRTSAYTTGGQARSGGTTSTTTGTRRATRSSGTTGSHDSSGSSVQRGGFGGSHAKAGS